jgi:hypothetical protein
MFRTEEEESRSAGAMNERMVKRKRRRLAAKGLRPCKKPPRYFHGGNFGLQIGEYILPPSVTALPQNGDVSPGMRSVIKF